MSRARLRARARTAASLPRAAARWIAIARAPRIDAKEPHVFYGVDRMPRPFERTAGGLVKFQDLDTHLPNTPRGFNVLYLGSSTIPRDAPVLARLARRRGAAFVWNQNGVAYPAWAGVAYEGINRPKARLLHAADHVFFQSEFCRLGADRFLGERHGPAEVLHNPVDVDRFVPDPGPRRRPLTLVMGGTHAQQYRLETAVQTIALVARDRPDVRLRIAGRIAAAVERVATVAELARRHGVADRVDIVGPYTHEDAPAVLRAGDILLHTQYNDACPSLVLEALACGLPVVYSASGGVPELVGDGAGIGVPAPLDWQQVHPPDPQQLAHGVLEVAARLDEYAAAARERAVERFPLDRWVARHVEVFESLLR